MYSPNATPPSRRRKNPAAALLFLGALVLSGCGTAAPSSAPTAGTPSATQSAASAPGLPSPAVSTTPAAAPAAKVPSPVRPAPAPAPVTVTVPAIGVQTPLVKLGLRKNGSLEVPPDGPGAPAGWYSGSPSPGETGPAVMLGHVNATDGGPGVFANLRGLKPGTEIIVRLADRSTAVFAVTRAAAYSKNSFPTLEVYGNTKGPELRLITCDGYDPASGLFNDNYVVYAKLKAKPAG
ncbi:class F sortase [Arthrobacter globiformis]|uniref:class F sortase n=1 Tax=Arthrobacter globiformis TaxID=1665 RepID=UPI00278F0F8E|nr:class F sortase [Arthrobacter globiformis]MDQ0620027.1 sortase (surface protein transpeptidase) [Arthrobacter globiformis]